MWDRNAGGEIVKERPPVALMTASTAMTEDCSALKKLGESGYEVVVVQDSDFERSLKMLEKVRRESLSAFNSAPLVSFLSAMATHIEESTVGFRPVGWTNTYFFVKDGGILRKLETGVVGVWMPFEVRILAGEWEVVR